MDAQLSSRVVFVRVKELLTMSDIRLFPPYTRHAHVRAAQPFKPYPHGKTVNTETSKQVESLK